MTLDDHDARQKDARAVNRRNARRREREREQHEKDAMHWREKNAIKDARWQAEERVMMKARHGCPLWWADATEAGDAAVEAVERAVAAAADVAQQKGLSGRERRTMQAIAADDACDRMYKDASLSAVSSECAADDLASGSGDLATEERDDHSQAAGEGHDCGIHR